MSLNAARLHEAVAATRPEADCVVWRGRRVSWSTFTDRTRRLAHWLCAQGLGAHGSFAPSAGPVSVHDHVAVYLHNGPEYLETMLGAWKARCAPINVNWRYVAEELAYVLADSSAAVVVYHEAFTPVLREALPLLARSPRLVRVPDGSAHDPLDGSVDYEVALTSASPDLPAALVDAWSPDDLYVLYTGGTTGRPKGTLWRQDDFLRACLGVDGEDEAAVVASLDPTGPDGQTGRDVLRALPSPPFMHGAAHWNALSAFAAGGTVVIQDEVRRLDPADVLDVCERERVTALQVVGDAFARPLVDEQRRRARDLSALRVVLSGGAILSAVVKRELTELLPGIRVLDVLGSSESGRQAVDRQGSGFEPSPSTVILAADRSHRLAPGEDEVGWLANTGRVPIGYLGDPGRSARTFPLIDGVRHAVPGDRARWRADGSVELLGRDAATINTGGEKVFAEEVEDALKHHPAVFDALVVGRPSERWGQEVCAVVQLRAETRVSDQQLLRVLGAHLARYKLPKVIVRVEQVRRSPSGKPDYAWARDQVGAG